MGRHSSDDSDEDDRRKRRRDDRDRDRDRRGRRSRSRDYEDRSSGSRRKKRRSRSTDRDRDEEGNRAKKRNKKGKKKHRRKRSSSSSSSSSSGAASDSSTELLRRLEAERVELKEKRRREKERLKATETPEEKRARRTLKKELKAVRRKERAGWADEEYSKYTNDDNPFGDANLTQTFRWGKKLQREGLDKLDDRELERLHRQTQEEQRLELEKVKQARLAREREREERQAAAEAEDRARENDKFAQWRRQEDDFHLQQARLRSKIRIRDGRAKPIDLLAKYVAAASGGQGDEDEVVDAVEMHEPWTYLNGLTVGDLEDLLADIRVYVGIDLESNRDFWSDIVVIVEDELSKLRKMGADAGAGAGDHHEESRRRRQGINTAVAGDVQAVFEGKTAAQLTQLQTSIERKLTGRADGLDVNYWESLLSQLKAHLARARLRDRHRDSLRKKLEMLKAEQVASSSSVPAAEEGVAKKEEKQEESVDDDDDGEPVPGPSREAGAADKEEEEEEEEPSSQHLQYMKKSRLPEDDETDPAAVEYLRGGYSPQYTRQDDLELGTRVVGEDEDSARLRSDRDRVLRGGKVEGVGDAEEAALEREAKKGMGGDEASFAVESALEVSYDWSDKYRPRKPRYFNRVHTGFEWNKYNQTHYDVDNPPPKIVQGYKFNIFYPDLIDKRATPQYTLTTCRDNPDFCVLRIRAGPPYEDIAFKIVKREWEYGYKRGFKCQFHNNIFQLWFHFKRLRYRR